MSTLKYHDTLQAYQEAISLLYGASPEQMKERGGADFDVKVDLESTADLIVQRSADLGTAAASGLESEVSGQRELAQLQLVAAAAIDLYIASDLVRRAEEGVPAEVVERGAGMPEALIDLQAILTADQDAGTAGLVADLVERGGQVDSSTLRNAIEIALDDIQHDAAAIGQATFSNLLLLPAPAIKDAANIVVSELLAKLGEGVSTLISKAVSLITQAINKLLQALGKDTEAEARKKVAEWIEDLQKGTLFEALVARLFDTPRILKEIESQLKLLPADIPAKSVESTQMRVSELAASYRKQKQALEWVMRGLTYTRPWIISLTPWGPIGLTAGYVLLIAYILYSGGDYVDWYRAGDLVLMDRVPGLRFAVSELVKGSKKLD